MNSKFQFVYNVEGMDMDFSDTSYGFWIQTGDIASCKLRVRTIPSFLSMLDSIGDSFDSYELADIDKLTVGQELEIDRGRGSWYSITRTK